MITYIYIKKKAQDEIKPYQNYIPGLWSSLSFINVFDYMQTW